jgi:hypothetical protein
VSRFYSKERWAQGLKVRAHRSVSDEALEIAAQRICALLARCEAVQANLAAAGAELHIVGEHQAVSDLPMYRHLAGKPFEGQATIDERGRGYGGLHACCGEESLLCLPSARHADHRDVCSHELAHTVLSFGLDARLQAAVQQRYEAALHSGLWPATYASTNVQEFFAELTMWYVGSRGDLGALPDPRPGPDWLRRYDPESFELLDAIYGGRLVPARIYWEEPARTRRGRTRSSGSPTSLVVLNQTPEVLHLRWLDYRGKPRLYATVASEAAVAQPTYASHVWQLTDARGRQLGRWLAGPRPGRVVLPGHEPLDGLL